MQRQLLVLLALALPSCGCGGGSPSMPSATSTPVPTPAPPTSITVTVVSGETAEPVAGAEVLVAGAGHTTDEAGRVEFTGDAVRGDPTVDILSADYLDRQTSLTRRAADGTLTLWPRQSPTGLDETITGEILYTTSALNQDPTFAPQAVYYAP